MVDYFQLLFAKKHHLFNNYKHMERVKTFGIIIILSMLVLACEKNMPSPVADFNLTIGENYLVTFENRSQNAEKYSWDFGDGQTSDEKNPTHTYKQGTYNITLTTSNGSGQDVKTVQYVVATQEKASATIEEPTDITNAGFNIDFHITEGRAKSSYEAFAQISDKEDFSNAVAVYENFMTHQTSNDGLIPIYRKKESLAFRDLIPNKQYFIRIKLVYTYEGETEEIYSATQSATTIAMPTPTLEITNYEENQTYFEVKSNLNSFEGNYNIIPDSETVFAYDENFTEIFTPEKVGYLLDTFYKEPSATVYVKTTFTYNGITKSTVESIDFENNFYDYEGWKGDQTLAYNDLHGNMVFDIIGESDKHIVFQVANFNGIGAYQLEGFPMDTNIDPSTINTAYLYPTQASERHELVQLEQMATLYIYKETETAYYGRIGNREDNISYLSFRSQDGNRASFQHIVFKAIKR